MPEFRVRARRCTLPCMSNFKQVTPFLHVPDVEEAVRFFVDVLGFHAWVHVNDYAYVHRETAGIRLGQRSNELGPLPGPQDPRYHEYSCYIDIETMEDLLAELRPKLADLPSADVAGPVDQPWGQRELLLRTPGGHLLVFGQAIAQVHPVNRPA